MMADVAADGYWVAASRDASRLADAGVRCLGPVTVEARCEGKGLSEARYAGRLELPGVTPPTPPTPPIQPTPPNAKTRALAG